ncbi:MAG: hypothetical protein ABH874_06230 [Methanobacteriota archaeon]
MDAKEATSTVRQYFDDIKKTKFFFDVKSTTLDETSGVWIVKCVVTNPFDEEPHFYKVEVDDETGDILNVEEIEE